MSNTPANTRPLKPDPPLLRFFRWVFPKIYWLSPSLAGRLAAKLFFTIFKYKFTVPEREFLKTAEWKTYLYRGKKIAYYHWENEGKPKIWCLHGWQGRAAQFRVMINSLRPDYDVIAIDLPAHGRSEGKRTNIKHSGEFLATFQKDLEAPYAIICHSFSGMATIFSRHLFDLNFDKLITVGSPVIGQLIYEEFLAIINAPVALSKHINDYVIKHFGIDFGRTSSVDLIKEMPPFPMLVVHDRDDWEAGIEHTEYLLKQVPAIESHITSGLGHTRILRNDEVIDRIKTFLVNNEQK